MSESDAAFAAGIALKSLDDLIRADLPWLGCWRDRFALKIGRRRRQNDWPQRGAKPPCAMPFC
jgi:hypothetical protein